MAKKAKSQTEDVRLAEIRKQLDTENIILGKDRTMKLLRGGELSKVFLSSNTEAKAREEIEKYAGLNDVRVETLDLNNEELGILCKKPFFVSVLSFRK